MYGEKRILVFVQNKLSNMHEPFSEVLERPSQVYLNVMLDRLLDLRHVQRLFCCEGHVHESELKLARYSLGIIAIQLHWRLQMQPVQEVDPGEDFDPRHHELDADCFYAWQQRSSK